MSAYAQIAELLPEGMLWRYEVLVRSGGRAEYQWAIANERGGVHVSAWRDSLYQGRWLGGIEMHSPKQLYGEPGGEPDHKHCWLLNGPCWHDGSSLQFSEQLAPAMPPEGEEMGEHQHLRVLRVMVNRHSIWLPAEEAVPCDSGRLPKGEDSRSKAECEASQSGGSEASASPAPNPDPSS